MDKQKFYDALVGFIIIDPMSRTIIKEKEFWEWITKNFEPKKQVKVEPEVSDDFAELYWKHRCEAAELFISESPCDPDITEKQIKAYTHWKKLCDIRPENYNK